MNGIIGSALLGLAIGDALGVPVEFMSRERMKRFPVTGMQEFGTHHQRAGTFSDDASLTLCLAEALCIGFDLTEIANNFALWKYNGYWSARWQVFDIGFATAAAIERFVKGTTPELAGGTEKESNGNGSLMRILPLVFYIKNMQIEDRFRITKQVSSITHGHVRSVIACFYYLEFTRLLLDGREKFEIYSELKQTVTAHLQSLGIVTEELGLFDRLLKGNIYDLHEDEISSSGYVLHTLEATVWCLLTTDNYEDAVLKAVNLGEDTDTTGAVTGGLAGILYGSGSIPAEWLAVLAKREDIEKLAGRLEAKVSEE